MKRDAKALPADATTATPTPDDMPALLAALMAVMSQPELQLRFEAMLAESHAGLLAKMRAMFPSETGDAAPLVVPIAPVAPVAAKRRPTVRDLFDEYDLVELPERDKAGTITPRGRKTIVTRQGRAAHILAHLCPDGTLLANREAESLTLLDIRHYVAARSTEISKKTRRPPTIAQRNRELALFRRVINSAIENTSIESTQIRTWKPVFKKEKNIRKTTLNAEQKEKLLAACLTDLSSINPRSGRKQELPPMLLWTIVLVLLDTGMRFSECRGMRWDKIDEKTGRIWLGEADTKTGEGRSPILPLRSFHAILALPRHPTSPYVFCHIGGPYDGKPWSPRIAYKWFRLAVEAAGLKGVDGEAIWFHTMRHTFVKDTRRRNIQPKQAMELTGHKTMATFMRYGATTEQETDETWRKVNEAIEDEARAPGIAAERKGPAHAKSSRIAQESTKSGGDPIFSVDRNGLLIRKS